MRSDLSPLNKNLFVQRNADGLPRLGAGENRLDIERLDRTNVRSFVRWGKHQMVADLEPSCCNAAGNDPPRIELIHILDRKAQRLLGSRGLLLEDAERLQHRWSAVPSHGLAAIGDVVPQFRAHRNDPLGYGAELTQEFSILLFDAVENVLPVTHKVHLVDDDRKLAHAEERQEVPVLF